MKNANWIILAVLAVVLFIIVTMTKKTVNNLPVDQSGFIDQFVKWLKKKEGGLSNDPDDGAASNSWPNGYHTNMGITKTTFENNASICGYSPTQEVFMNMTPQIWWCNYQTFYAKGLAYTNNLVLSTYISQWYWGGWDQTIVSKSRVVSALNNPPAKALSKLVDLRIEYFTELVKKKPSYQKYKNGWINKAKDFREKFTKFA